MNNREQQYYKQLQISRAQEQKEKIAGEVAGKTAVTAAKKFYGLGYIPGVKQAIRKTGEVAGKKIYRKRKWIIAMIIAAIVLPPLIIFALTFFVITISTYAIVCYNPFSYLLSLIPGLSGLIAC